MTTTKVPPFTFESTVRFPKFLVTPGALKGTIDRNKFCASYESVTKRTRISYDGKEVVMLPNLCPVRFVPSTVSSQIGAQKFNDAFVLSHDFAYHGEGGCVDILIPNGRYGEPYQFGGGISSSWRLCNGGWDSYLNIGVMYNGSLTALIDAVQQELTKNAGPDLAALQAAADAAQSEVEAACNKVVEANQAVRSAHEALETETLTAKSVRKDWEAAIAKRDAAFKAARDARGY